jgi:hypothetical protein
VRVKVTFVGSPLLGPAVWRPAAGALERLGWAAHVVPAMPRAPREPGEVLEHLLGQLPPDEDVALVAHSNAGLYVPALAARRPVVASVFADAALPPVSGSAPMAAPERLPMLRELADEDGLLPPWTSWWPADDVAQLFPDAAVQAAVEAEQQRLPLAYFSGTLAVPDGWVGRPAAYLAFSEAYLPGRAEVSGWGWPVRTLPGGHLHALVDPEAVAATLADLLRELAPGAR